MTTVPNAPWIDTNGDTYASLATLTDDAFTGTTGWAELYLAELNIEPQLESDGDSVTIGIDAPDKSLTITLWQDPVDRSRSCESPINGCRPQRRPPG